MKITEQTQKELDRAIRKIADKFPTGDDASVMTDIHVRVTQETGELTAFDDDDREITRCIVEQWIDNKDTDFYSEITAPLRQTLLRLQKTVDSMAIIKPFSFVLEDDDKESVAELYVADDDTIIIDGELMAGLNEELDDFFDKLMKE